LKVARIGWLVRTSSDGSAPGRDLFLQGLGALGYVEGQNLAIEYRGEVSDARLAEAAAELARLPVDVLVVRSVTDARLAREATQTVAIVLMGAAGDPVAAGLAASYARPGGNVTGVTILGEPLSGKRLQLLKEAVPSIARVAVLLNAEASFPVSVDTRVRDAQAVGVQLHLLELRDPEELDAAFESTAREGADALFVVGSPLASAHRARIVQLAARLGWPAMYDARPFVQAGGLMAYEASPPDLWRRIAALVDKIIKGTPPGEIPIEQPMRFDFVVNLKTAQTLGLTFPHEIMLQVTEVIQ